MLTAHHIETHLPRFVALAQDELAPKQLEGLLHAALQHQKNMIKYWAEHRDTPILAVNYNQAIGRADALEAILKALRGDVSELLMYKRV